MNIPVLEPLNPLISLLYLLVMYKCIKTFFGLLRWTPVLGILWGIYYVFQVISSLTPVVPSQLLLIGNIVLVFFISSFSPCGGLKRRCLFSVLVCMVWMLVEIIVVTTIKSWGLDGTDLRTVGSVISELCMFILAVITGRYMQGRLNQDLPQKYFLTALLIPVCSIYLIHHIQLIAYSHGEYSRFAVSASVILLLVSYVVFEIYDLLAREAQTREENHLYEQQLELCSRQAEEREILYLEIRRIRHDMRNHLLSLEGMVGAGDRDGAVEYIRSLLDDGIGRRKAEVSRSGNIVVDSLINHKYELACREGINFDANVFLPVSLPFKNGHLAIVFGNLLDNAMEACRKVDAGGRYIWMEAGYTKGMLHLMVKNPYNGDARKDPVGKFVTWKDKRYHGVGLASVEQAVVDYHGMIEIQDCGGVFRVSVVMYGKK